MSAKWIGETTERISGAACWLLVVSMFSLALPVAAQDAAPSNGTVRPAQRPVGDNTREILAAQREGTQAGPLLPMTGEQGALGYTRYMNSFTYPLPEFMGAQTSGSALRGGVSNAGNMSAPAR